LAAWPAGYFNKADPNAGEHLVKAFLIAATMIFVVGSVLAQDATQPHDVKIFNPDALTWKDNPMFPKGVQSVVLVGNPTKAEMFILRSKFPPNYKVPPHTHPVAEVITILTGKMGHGLGEHFDSEKGEMLKTGSVVALPANHAHYVWTTDDETIVQIQAAGPMDITYINSADDPRKK
jgi:quercetin dioxygenase-like cupin family protein